MFSSLPDYSKNVRLSFHVDESFASQQVLEADLEEAEIADVAI